MKVYITQHFLEQWNRYIYPDKQSKIKRYLAGALKNSRIYGRKDGSFEVLIKGTKAIVVPGIKGWTGITVLDPKSAEMELHRSGLGEIAREYGAKLAFGKKKGAG